MDGTTAFGGLARARSARGGERRVAAGDGRQVRGQRQLRGQADERWRRRGTLAANRVGGAKRSTLAAHAGRVRALLAAESDLTIAELRGRLAADGIAVSRSGLGRFLIAAGLTREKDPARCRARPARRRRRPQRLARVAADAERGAAGLHRRDLGDHRHGAAPRPGPARRARGGCRAARPLENHDLPGCAPPRPHERTPASSMARSPAPASLRMSSKRWPTLRPGDIVVMDNLGAHKIKAVLAIAGAGAEFRYLPPHSPDLNPIEHAVAKLKAPLRAAARRSCSRRSAEPSTLSVGLDANYRRRCGAAETETAGPARQR